MLRISGALLLLSCFLMPARGGAWLYRSETGQAMYQLSYTSARHSFGSQSGEHFYKLLMKGYTEYALSDRVTAITEQQYVIAGIKSAYGTTSARDYAARSGVRVGVFSGVNVVSLEASYQYGQAFAMTVSDDDISRSQQAEARVLFGRNFYVSTHKIFTDLEVYWRWTAPPRPNEAGFDATVGIRLFPQTRILLQNFSVLSAGYGADSYAHYALHKAELSVVQRLYREWYLQLGTIYSYSGRNVVAERGVSLGLWVPL